MVALPMKYCWKNKVIFMCVKNTLEKNFKFLSTLKLEWVSKINEKSIIIILEFINYMACLMKNFIGYFLKRNYFWQEFLFKFVIK